MKGLDLSDNKVPNPFYKAPNPFYINPASALAANTTPEHTQTDPQEPTEELDAVNWPWAEDDPDESDDEVWVGTAEDQRKAWLKRWPKTMEEALEPLIDDQPKFTTSFVHANVCIKIMNTRTHVGNRHMRRLLLESALAHAKVVSFLHYGPGQKKNKVEEIFPDAPPTNDDENTDMSSE